MHLRLLALAALLSAGCSADPPADALAGDSPPAPAPAPPAGPSLASLADAAPPSLKSVPMHGCAKIRFLALGAMLRSRGITLEDAPAGSAAELWRSGADALGVARYGERVRETLTGSTAASEKRDDVFVAAAVEIHRAARAATWKPPGCPGVTLFDASRDLTIEGISCLIGKPASTAHVALAHGVVSDVLAAAAPGESATDARDRGERIAIAALLSAAHGCE